MSAVEQNATSARRRPRPAKRRKAKKRVKKIPGLYYPLNISPEEFFRELGRARKVISAEVERLIEFLDRTGGCPDLDAAVDDGPCDDDERELDAADDEPSLGSLERAPTGRLTREGRQTDWAAGNRADLEDEHDGRETGDDNEPSLAGSINHHQQQAWGSGDSGDYEDEHDGAEPDYATGDLEPSLGSLNPHEDRSQVGWGNLNSDNDG